MKKLFFSAVVMLLSMVTVAQEMPEMPQLPKDSAIIYGVLPNGLTYYVRHNEEPKGQAEFYIAQNVGSMQEEENQLGLAHFLEHMCFNGTKNFPGKNLINYLESIGVQFGRNLNAYTSFDETVYNISAVPVSREGIVDSCLLILHDWSHDLLLEDAEIDAERGVIHQEWNTSNASRRMFTNLLPQVYPDSRYGLRMPIGTMEIVDNFPYQDLRDYYHTWYRPDLQAILVVGDIDAKAVEEKIKTVFTDIPKPKKAKKREWLEVADNKAPIVGIVSDKEQTVNQCMVMWKSDVMPTKMKNTMLYFLNHYVEQAICGMINIRISELMQKPNPPFLRAGVGMENFMVSKTKDAATLSVTYADGMLDKALTVALTELLRATRHGFTVSEYQRFYEEYMRNYEQYYIERDKRTSGQYVQEYVRNFTDNEPIPGIEAEYQIMNMIAPNMPLNQINEAAKQIVTDENMVVALMNTATEQPTTREHILELIEQVKNSDIEPYVDEVIDRPLIENIPTAGKIVKEEEGMYGSTVLTLNNGIRVIMRSTDFQADAIQFTAYRDGGTTTFEDSEVEQALWIDPLHSLMGVGEFSAIDLQKVLSGKQVSVNASVASNGDNVSGSCSVRDLETMLQLTTLQFTPQRIDEDAFASFKQRTRLALENQEANPMKSFQDSLQTIMTSNPARLVLTHPELIDRIDLQRVKAMYDSRFDHADGFTFIFVGNLDGEGLKEQIAQYLGSLPVKGVEDKNVYRGQNFRRGVYESVFERKMEMDRSTVYMIWQAEAQFSMKNDVVMDALVQAMENLLLTKMREEAGATYSPSVAGSVQPYFFGDEAQFLIGFQTSPEMRETLINIANTELARVAEEGVDDEQLTKTRQLLIKDYKEAQRKNGAMTSYLNMYYRYGHDCKTDYMQAVLEVSSDDVRDLAKKLLEQNNRVMVSMSPLK